jgi:hypothetical protein
MISGIAYSQNSIEKEIGNEIVTFNIPASYNELELYYRAIVDAYCAAENMNINLANSIELISSSTNSLKESSETLQKDFKDLEDNYKNLISIRNKTSFYLGFTGGYGLLLSPDGVNNAITLGPVAAFGNKKSHWQIGLPLTVTTPDFTFGIGISASVLFSAR